MTEHGVAGADQRRRKRRLCCTIGVSTLSLLLILLIIGLILGFTVFKVKDPTTDLISATLQGVSPHISFPVIQIQLNITLDLQIRVHNPNHASFKHGTGKSILLYNQHQVGDADISPGNIPASGSATVSCRLTLEADRLVGSNLTSLLKEIMGGQLEIETRTRIPGRATVFGFIKKHVVAVSVCHLSIGFPSMTILSQECTHKTIL